MLTAPRAVDGGQAFSLEVTACSGGTIDTQRSGTVSLALDAGSFAVSLASASAPWASGRAQLSATLTGLGLDVQLEARDATLSAVTSLDVRRGRAADAKRLLVDQGAYELISGPGATAADRAAVFWAQADIVVLSHLIDGSSIDPACGVSSPVTVATARAALPRLRRLSGARVFLYVPAPADAPAGQECGNAHEPDGGSLTDGDWTCPAGRCSKFIAWVDQLEQFNPDGYFLDYFSLPPAGAPTPTRGYKLGLATAQNLVSYVALRSRAVMVNTLYSSQPNVAAILPAFDAWPSTAPRPRLLLEGWYVRDGALDPTTLQGSDYVGMDLLRRARFARDFITSESQALGAPFSCAFMNGATAFGLFGMTRVADDTFQYSRSSLYIGAARADPYCTF